MEKGSIGYMTYIKRKNLTYALIGMGAMLGLYFTGLIIVGNNGSSWTLIAVLLALPAAQFLTRYISLRHYASLSESDELTVDHLRPETTAYELALVIGKKTYYVEKVVVTAQQITLLSMHSDINPKIVMDFLKTKGVISQVQVYKDITSFNAAIQPLKMLDLDQTKAIRDILINNAL